MHDLAYFLAAFAAGLTGLIWSADRFVDSAVGIANFFRLPALLIGTTIVSLGTSAPEILISVQSTFQGAGDLAIGNALGSNIANMGLVLAVTLLISPIPITRSLLFQEMSLLMAITVVAGFVLWDTQLTPLEGMSLLCLAIPTLLVISFIKKNAQITPKVQNTPVRLRKPLLSFLVSLILLSISANILVWGATQTAFYFGVSPLIIGLTAVALGTSLPELAASASSALKGQHDIALGNVIGSNLFNLLIVMAIPGVFHPLQVDSQVFNRDFLTMAVLTALIVIGIIAALTLTKRPSKPQLGRFFGSVLLLAYFSYVAWLFRLEIAL